MMVSRESLWERIEDHPQPWDFIVVGGGATGLGIAVDAANRGFDVLLLEQVDFGKGTSSKSTKLIHGGVRYLAQGRIGLVREALSERSHLQHNAPHLVRPIPFVVPVKWAWRAVWYGLGLKLYDRLARDRTFPASHRLSSAALGQQLPHLRRHYRGGIVYYDGQFDDTRFLISLARTALEQGAVVVNHAPVKELLRTADGQVVGVRFEDSERARGHEARARAVINATGAAVDALRRSDQETPLVQPSQGVHIVLDGGFLGGDCAVLLPRTADGRVLFAIPWYGQTLVGTTDTPVGSGELEPRAKEEELGFLLESAAQILARAPTREDIRSVFAGIRPLVNSGAANTARLSREEYVEIDESGLVTITGGKWTTYRLMAERCVDECIAAFGFEKRRCRTRNLALHGCSVDPQASYYGTDAPAVDRLAEESRSTARLHARFAYREADVRWAVRYELARTIEDVLARRTRLLFLDARAALEVAPRVVELMAEELGRGGVWAGQQLGAFRELARAYLVD